jgi:hypothetical protein
MEMRIISYRLYTISYQIWYEFFACFFLMRHGGQGAHAKRESAQAKKDVAASAPCDHCGKKHAGECWYKPGSKKRTRCEKKALKAAAELSRVESGEDTGSEVEETFDNRSRVSLLPPSSRIPRTCTVLHANLFIATPTRNAYPGTQAEVSITNTPEHVVRKHSKSARVQGLLGKSQIAQYADLAFRLKTDKGRHITLRIRKPGLFLPEAKEILLAHQDLEDSGFRVNYHTGKMRSPSPTDERRRARAMSDCCVSDDDSLCLLLCVGCSRGSCASAVRVFFWLFLLFLRTGHEQRHAAGRRHTAGSGCLADA